jgi:hypothetical protein
MDTILTGGKTFMDAKPKPGTPVWYETRVEAVVVEDGDPVPTRTHATIRGDRGTRYVVCRR